MHELNTGDYSIHNTVKVFGQWERKKNYVYVCSIYRDRIKILLVQVLWPSAVGCLENITNIRHIQSEWRLPTSFLWAIHVYNVDTRGSERHTLILSTATNRRPNFNQVPQKKKSRRKQKLSRKSGGGGQIYLFYRGN